MSEPRFGRLFQLLFGFYFLEAGLFLVLVPWSRLWALKVVAPSPAWLEPLLASPAFRGFVAGIGVLHLALAVRDLLGRGETPA